MFTGLNSANAKMILCLLKQYEIAGFIDMKRGTESMPVHYCGVYQYGYGYKYGV